MIRPWAVTLGLSAPYVSTSLPPPARIVTATLPPPLQIEPRTELKPATTVAAVDPKPLPPVTIQPVPDKPVLVKPAPVPTPQTAPRKFVKRTAKPTERPVTLMVSPPKVTPPATSPGSVTAPEMLRRALPVPPMTTEAVKPIETVQGKSTPKDIAPEKITQPEPEQLAALPLPQKVPALPKQVVPPSEYVKPAWTTPEGQPVPEEDGGDFLTQLHKKAYAGDAAAQLALAKHYHTGGGVSVSQIKAMFWYQKAALQGVAEAQLNLGMIYHAGDGVPKNPAKAYRWINMAAGQNDPRAQAVLKALHRSMPAPVFTAMVFPDSIILEPDPIIISSQTVRAQPASAKNITGIITGDPVNIQAVDFWKPDIVVLGNKPLP
ncbi:MAG: hypothetical protein VW802_06965 [Rhodospirillaceae bacterium]|jgi:hypothetical protein